MNQIFLAIAALMTLALCGCGGGGGSPAAEEEPSGIVIEGPNFVKELTGGIWSGTSTSDQGGANQNLLMVSTDSGRLRALSLSTGAQFVGTVSTTQDDFSGSGVAIAPQGFTWPDTTLATPFNITGQFSQRAAVTSTWTTTATSESGTINIQYDSDLHARRSSLEKIAGNWVNLTQRTFSTTGTLLAQGTTDANFTFTDTGIYTGNDEAGCQYSGAVILIDPEYNVYNVTSVVSNCVGLNNIYTGLAACRV